MQKSVVKTIGPQAIDKHDKMLILFGEQATDELQKVSIIHHFVEPRSHVTFQAGGTIYFDEQAYTIQFVGRLAEENFNALGHVTLIFDEAPEEDSLGNALYLSPFELPNITSDTIISYK